MNSNSKISALLVALLLSAAVPPASGWAHIPIPPKESGAIGRRVVDIPVPDFRLVDQNGKPFHFRNSRGQLVLVTFIFTACPDVCPLLTAKFAAIQRMLDQRQFNEYLMLSITTDPARDSAAALRRYAENFKADLGRWSFLTGTPAELAKVWKSFGVNVTQTRSGDVNHTSLTTLIDRRGHRRIDYYGDKWREKAVLEDIEWLAARK